MAVDAGTHAGMDGRDIAAGIEEVAALQLPFSCFAGVAYQRIGKDDVWRRCLVEVLIIDVEVDAHSLCREYPYLAVVGVCDQSGQVHVASGHPLLRLHPCETISKVNVLARSGIKRSADGVALCMERLDDILQEQLTLATIPPCGGFQLGVPEAECLAGSGYKAISVGIGALVERGLDADNAVVVITMEQVLMAVLNAATHVEEEHTDDVTIFQSHSGTTATAFQQMVGGVSEQVAV